MQGWTFENDNGKCPQMEHAHFYVENWETMKERNIGYLLWGGVGTGKSYFAGCIANALMEREIPVCMTNFALILGDLAAALRAGMNISPDFAASRCLSLTIWNGTGNGIRLRAGLQRD